MLYFTSIQKKYYKLLKIFQVEAGLCYAPVIRRSSNMCKLEDALNQQLLTRLDQLISILTPAKANYQKQSKLLDSAHSFIWQAHSYELKPINRPAKLPLELFTGIDSVKDILMQNSLQFAQGFSANNCLLWGARGMGKSSLIKAIHHKIVETYPLKLIEISRNDLSTLSILLDILANSQHRVILFCDDLSFEQDTQDYKALKSLLDGGLETRPQNLLFYATSNRKHLLPRQAIENEQATASNLSLIHI